MNDKRLDYMLKTNIFTKQIWKGFLAPDIELQNKPSSPFPHLWIVNNAPTYTGGEHWCALFINKDYCEFFDSFGRSPIQNGVLFSFLKHCTEKIQYNNIQYQSIYAKTCGHHCVFFSVLRAQGMSAKEIKNLYSETNLKQNDDMVVNFVWKEFGKFFAEIESDV